jgi:hypothetical protein
MQMSITHNRRMNRNIMGGKDVLAGVVVTVFATGRKVCEFKPGRGR